MGIKIKGQHPVDYWTDQITASDVLVSEKEARDLGKYALTDTRSSLIARILRKTRGPEHLWTWTDLRAWLDKSPRQLAAAFVSVCTERTTKIDRGQAANGEVTCWI